MTTNLNMAHREWASRPDDQRYVTLEDLEKAVSLRKKESWTAAPKVQELRVVAPQDEMNPLGDLRVQVFDPVRAGTTSLVPTHFAFGQLAQYAKAPASYLRTLPDVIAAINLQWCLEHNPIRESALVLAQSNGSENLRGMTSLSYGRIWDSQVVHAVQQVNASGAWKVPAASYATTDPKRATTLYASDRDVFIFLVDPEHPIEVKGETLFRGFITWNSEVGDATFGLRTFLYRYVCDNRIIWDATEVRELRIRHTGGAPERFGYEGAKFLQRYATESPLVIEGQVKAAMEKDVPLDSKHGETVQSWLQGHGFTAPEAKASVETARQSGVEPRSVWDVINGVTAYARAVGHTNDRVDLERRAGALMRYASPA